MERRARKPEQHKKGKRAERARKNAQKEQLQHAESDDPADLPSIPIEAEVSSTKTATERPDEGSAATEPGKKKRKHETGDVSNASINTALERMAKEVIDLRSTVAGMNERMVEMARQHERYAQRQNDLLQGLLDAVNRVGQQ